MANADRMTITLVNTDVGPANTAQVGFSAAAVGWSAQKLAQVLGYFGALGSAGMIAVHTAVQAADQRAFGSAGNVPQAFPAAEYADLVTAASAVGISMPSMTDYGDTFGVGNLAPLGTSISVSEVTATPGRSGRGRHFVPFVSRNAVDTDGSYGNGVTHLDLINFFFEATNPDGSNNPDLEALLLVVAPASGVGTKLIIQFKPQPVFSNLESRRR